MYLTLKTTLAKWCWLFNRFGFSLSKDQHIEAFNLQDIGTGFTIEVVPAVTHPFLSSWDQQ